MDMERILEPIRNRIRLIVGRAVIAASKKSDGNLTLDLELLAGEKRRGVEFMQQYGFSSRPKGDASAVVVFVGGSRDNGIAIASRGDGAEMTDAELEEGESMMHSPFGSKILLKKDGSVVITLATGKKVLIGSDVEITGNLTVSKSVTAVADVVAMNGAPLGVSLATHTHVCAAPGSPSGLPNATVPAS